MRTAPGCTDAPTRRSLFRERVRRRGWASAHRSIDEVGDRRAIGFDDLPLGRGRSAEREARADADDQCLHERRVRFLACVERGVAEVRVEAVQLEEEAVLALGQELERGLRALARVERAAAQHLALAAEVLAV